MNRVKENEKLIESLTDDLVNVSERVKAEGLVDPSVTRNIHLSMIASTLMDIARSLAVIADKMED